MVDLITTAGGGTTGIDGLFTTVGVAAGGDAALGAGGDATLGAGGDATLGAGGATGFGATGLGATLLKIRNNFREEESFVVVALTLTSTKGNEVFTSADSNEALTSRFSISLTYNP